MIRFQAGGKLFSVTFVKRSDGSLRRIVGRRRTEYGVNGTGKSFDDAEKKLLSVLEFATERDRATGRIQTSKPQWRSFGIKPGEIRELKIGGQVYHVAN